MIEAQLGTAQASADILVVDDTSENLRVVVGLLKEAGYKARGVPNGELALQAVARQSPDLILLDIRMPGMDGFQVCEALHDNPRSRDIPIIFLSALTDTADKQRAFEAGGVDYITKPFQATEVLSRVNTHLELARNRRALIHTRDMLERLSHKQAPGTSKDVAAVAELPLPVRPADILVVDDETEYLHLLIDLLRERGYKARGVSSGEMALQAVDKQPPDLILMDIIMPGMDGFQVCAALRDNPQSRDIPLIFLTQLTGVANIEQAFKAGAVDYIIKPVKPEEMLARVDTHLRLRRMQLDLEQMVAERAAELAASEEKFRVVAEQAPIALVIIDPEQRIQYCNRRFWELFGYEPEDIGTMEDWWLLGYPDEAYRNSIRSLWTEAVEHAFKTKSEIVPQESWVTCKNGERRYIEWRMASLVKFGLVLGTDITERQHAEVELLRLNRALHALSSGNRALVHEESEQSLLDSMCRAIAEAGYVLAWVGYAMQDESRRIVPMAECGSDGDYVRNLQITWADQVAGYEPTGLAVRTGQPSICHEIRSEPPMEPWREAAINNGFASIISLPLKYKDQLIGALSIYSAEPDAFQMAEVALLEEMAEDLAFGIVNHRIRAERDKALSERQGYADQLRASMEDALQAIATTMEMRDPYTAGHQRRVADLAVAIARKIGLDQEQIHSIHLAGIVHDIGKIRVPAEILSKPGRLSELEYSLIKCHSQSGYDILKDINFPWPIALAVLQHHERLDGSGYPLGLKNHEILYQAKILAVADVVEAIASHRPYRPGLGVDAALDEIISRRGVAYDAGVVDACIAIFREEGYSFT